jgi:predicted DNA-binding transcriptional regulator AlpA
MRARYLDYEDLRAKGIKWSKTTLWRKERAKPPQFPKRVPLSPSRVAWVESEIDAYMAGLIAKRDRAETGVGFRPHSGAGGGRLE